MLQYVDGFTCAVNNRKDALIIKFIQNDPILSRDDDDPKNVKINNIEIASIVMTYEAAKALLNSLNDLMYQAENEDEIG